MEAAASAPPSTVLVVGAGPVGLTAATVLAHHVDAAAARIVVIDAAASPCPPEQSRALVLWRRALQALDPYVPAEAWAANGRGQPMRAALFAEEGAVLGRVDFAPGGEPQQQQHVLPAGMLIKQADVEDVLGGVLAARYNVTVRRSTRLVGLAAADDGSGDLLCELASASGGGSEVLRASHVIGCDGARSTVRKALGVRFSGATLGNQRWLLGDFEYEAAAAADGSVCRRPPPPRPEEAAPSPGCLLLSTSRHGTLGLLPVGAKHGVVRLVWNPPATEAPAGEPTMAHFQAALQAGTRMQIRLTRPLWVSEFVINERMVDKYVHHGGRVLLAGDAAHIHSPAGGQGMNTGVQDAVNLGWKVALAVSRELAPAATQRLLESYEQERLPVGRQVIKSSGVVLRANTFRNPLVRMLRAWALRLALRLPPVRARMVALLAGDDIRYTRSSSLVAAATHAAAAPMPAGLSSAQRRVWASAAPGRAFPDVAVSCRGQQQPATVLLRAPRSTCGTLVLLLPPGDGGEGDDAWPAVWGGSSSRLHVVRVLQQAAGPPPAGSDGGAAAAAAGAHDAWGLLAAALGVTSSSSAGVLVRPDGVVAAVGAGEKLTNWLQACFLGV